METFEAFFGREYRRVLGLAYALSGDWVVAEKVTADGFAAAHARWNQVSVLNSPGAWVSKPVSEAAIRASRKSTPESTPLLEGSEVWDSVRQLPKPQARIIALSYVTGASQREIAVLLRESEETIATSLEVGRTQLEQMMGVDGHGDRILRGQQTNSATISHRSLSHHSPRPDTDPGDEPQSWWWLRSSWSP